MCLRSNNRKRPQGSIATSASSKTTAWLATRRCSEPFSILYLGEIDDQQAAWRKTLSVFDEEQHLSLFPDDREIPARAVDSRQVKLSGLELRRPRLFGSCRLGCELCRQLGMQKALTQPPGFWRFPGYLREGPNPARRCPGCSRRAQKAASRPALGRSTIPIFRNTGAGHSNCRDPRGDFLQP
jgi:rubrerythrin